MGKVIQFPRLKLQMPEQGGLEDEPDDQIELSESADSFVARILQRRHVRGRDESLLDDKEFRQMLAGLQRMEAEEDRLLDKLERETSKGTGVFFWVCLLLIILF